jgi:hypothetical protein
MFAQDRETIERKLPEALAGRLEVLFACLYGSFPLI